MKIDKIPPETRDAKCRAILSTKSLISLIAQDLLPEYQGYFRKEIETFIEQGLDTKDKIIGLNNEDGITQKDIVFFMKNPIKDEKIGLIINLEMQVKAYSIAYYSMQEQRIEGNGKEGEHTYDLCGIYLLRLADNSNRKVL